MENNKELLTPATYLWSTHPVKRWSYPLDLFRSISKQIRSTDTLDAKASIAWEIDEYWVRRRTQNSLKVIQVASLLLSTMSKKYPHLSQRGESIMGKLQPSITEAVSETIKRLKFLSDYIPSLPSHIMSCVSGGSMSYGRFFNVRGGEYASDLDLIMVYENDHVDNLSGKSMFPPHLGFESSETNSLDERLKIFSEMTKKHEAQVLSHKTTTLSGLEISMHLMSREVFNNSMIFGPQKDISNGLEVDRRVYDYKSKPFKHQVMTQRDMYGNKYNFFADESPVKGGQTDQEVISKIPAYAIKNGQYVPGVYQNLVSPRFEFEPHTKPLISAAVTMYWGLMQDLATKQKLINPEASVLKSHIRYDLFSPRLKQYYD